jgi:2-polyprenyl-3-methyl-5-hydroxy-6-metoxy-1,4-benzoquinol methylase
MSNNKKTCPVCAANDFSEVDSFTFGFWKDLNAVNLERQSSVFNLAECQNCLHIMVSTTYTDQMFEDIYGQQSEGNIYWGEGVDDHLKPYEEMVEFAFDGDAKNNHKIIDLGCGNGTLLKVIADKFSYDKSNLLGVDFHNYMAAGFNFETLSLNEKNDIATCASLGNADMVFCSHVVEHLVDPFVTLSAVCKKIKPSAKLYIEVPDNSNLLESDCGNVSLVNQQHIQYFTLSNMIKMLERCGFDILKAAQKTSGEIPRLMMLVKKSDGKNGKVEKNQDKDQDQDQDINQAVSSLAELKERRGQFADMVIADVLCTMKVGIWGIGADFYKTIEENPEFEEMIASDLVTLFDRDLAGKIFMGKTIVSSDEIKNLENKVYLSTMLRYMRQSMIAHATKIGIPSERIIDPYQ